VNATTAPPHAAIQSLAIAVADHGRSLGLRVIRIQASRVKCSASHHLVFRDRRNRDWHLRLSGHRGPLQTGYAAPHFDLVTVDGREGSELAFGFLNRVARGDEPWTPPKKTRALKGRRCWGRR